MDLSQTLQIILAFVIGFSVVVAVIPPILKVARAKKLFDCPDFRKIHKQEIPQLGGIAIFGGLIFGATFLLEDHSFISLKYIMLSIILLLGIGLKDDLIGVSPFKKFIFQILTAVILIFFGNIHFIDLYGIFGWHHISAVFGVLLTLFTILYIINAFNFIDGIDGLASGLALVASMAFGLWFFLAGYMQYAIISISLAGSLFGFFLYNVFGRKNKLFMGDTGSLFVGLLIAILTVKFNEFNLNHANPWSLDSAPVISLAIVLVPLIDVLRVVVLRVINGKSPFYPDNNHIHHRLLALVPHHLTVTLIIISGNLFLILLAVLLHIMALDITIQFVTILFAGITLSFIPSFIVRLSERKKNWNGLQTWPD